jgi:4-hydroxy-tetrahydrodipicolinate synthase
MFRGSITALITPFRQGSLDEDAFSRLVEWQVEQGTHGLVPMGTTGESPTVTRQEHERIIELCVEAAAGRVPVIAGTGSNNTQEAIEYTRFAKKVGADGALVVAPYYNKPGQEGLYQHYKAIHDAVDIPIIVYNIPGRSVVDVSVATMARLAELPNIIGVKEATGDVTRILAHREAIGEDFIQLSGDDPLALAVMACGGHGCISVASNIAPGLCAQFQQSCMDGDFATALKLHENLMPLHRAIFMETSPAPVKYAAERLGVCSGELRLPLVGVGRDTAQTLDAVIRKLKLKGPGKGPDGKSGKGRG